MVDDLPSMYLDVYGSKNTIEVLQRYSDLAKEWIENVESEVCVDDCYPFNAQPTIEMSNM